jgi:hypothetical protein
VTEGEPVKDWIHTYFEDDDEFLRAISNVSLLELFDLIMQFPEYMSDPYYEEFRLAIYERYRELR